MARGMGLGVVLWFFLAVYFGVVVGAAFPQRAAYLRDMASAALFPLAVIGALVMVRQGMTAPLARLVACLALGGLLWLGLAAGVGTVLTGGLEPESVQRLFPAVSAGLLALSFGLAWWSRGWWGPRVFGDRWADAAGEGPEA